MRSLRFTRSNARRAFRPSSLIAAATIAASVLALAGCGGGESESAAASGGVPDKLRIGYQLIPNGDLVVKDQEWLEAALPDTEIEWIQFDSGGDVNTAIVGNSIDIGLAGSSPVTKGIAPPLEIPYRVPWIFDVIGTNEALVVRNESGIADIGGLAGKKIGTPFASTSHYSLLAALELAGVDPTSVDIIDLQPPDILAAWQRGDIDGAYVWTPTLAELRKDGTTLISSAELSEQGKTTADLAVVRSDFADQYPDVVATWAAQQDKAVALYRSDPDAAAAAIGRQLNLSPEEALAQAKELVWLSASEQASADWLGTTDAPGGGLADNLLSAAEFLQTQDAIDSVPSREAFAAAIDPAYAAKAAS